jgi:hypothetical protein
VLLCLTGAALSGRCCAAAQHRSDTAAPEP